MIKRMLKFDRKDWKHIISLFINAIKQLILGNFYEYRESLWLMRIHLTHDSIRRNDNHFYKDK